MNYQCTIFCHDYFNEEEECWLEPEHVPAVRLASATVVARGRREAAARAFVRTVGRYRVKKFRKKIGEPAECWLRLHTRWRIFIGSLVRVQNWLGDCYMHDNCFEAYYIQVERLPVSRIPSYREIRRRRLLRSLAVIIPN